MSFIKNHLKFSLKLFMLLSISASLLLTLSAMVSAGPFLNNPDDIAIFITRDGFNGADIDDDLELRSYYGTNIGISIPIGKEGGIGLRSTQDVKQDYCFYEFFVNWTVRDSLKLDINFLRMDEDCTVLRFGAYRKLPFSNGKTFNSYLGPGVSAMTTWDDWDADSSFKIFFQSKNTFSFGENFFVYGNALYDFNFSAGQYEAGIGITY